MKAKLLPTFFMLLSSGIAYAGYDYDYVSGSRVDWDDYGGGGIGGDFAIVLGAIAVIGILIFIAYLYFSDKIKNRPKPQERKIEIGSPEWYAIQEAQAKREKQEKRGCIIGLIIFVGFWVELAFGSSDKPIKALVTFFVPAILFLLAMRSIIGNKFIPDKLQGFVLFVAFVLAVLLLVFFTRHFSL